jgi:CRISPR-associated protein Csa3
VEAYEEVEDILTRIVPDIPIEKEHIPYTDFVESVLLLAELIQEVGGETIVILGGGAREVLFPLTVATFSCSHSIATILQVGDIDGSVQRVPHLSLRGNTSAGEADFLNSLTDLTLPLSISDIATQVDKSKSTVARHIKRLEGEGLVKTKEGGRTKMVRISDSGRIFLTTQEPRTL